MSSFAQTYLRFVFKKQSSFFGRLEKVWRLILRKEGGKCKSSITSKFSNVYQLGQCQIIKNQNSN